MRNSYSTSNTKIRNLVRGIKFYIRLYSKWLYPRLNILYYNIMCAKIARFLKEGDKVFYIDNTTKKVKEKYVNAVEENNTAIHLGETREITDESIFKDNIDNFLLKGEHDYYLSPIIAIWCTIRRIRDEEIRLERERIAVLKANHMLNANVTITNSNGEKVSS